MIDIQTIKSLSGANDTNAKIWQPYFNDLLPKNGINTKERLVAFLSQVGHESGGLSRTSENLNYDASGLLKTFKNYFDVNTSKQYARQPQKIANKVYANRMGNGSESSGEGWVRRGRGLMQVTGKTNQLLFGKAFGIDTLNHPELIAGDTPSSSTSEQLKNAVLSAIWYWNNANLNQYADKLNLQKPMTDPSNLDTIKIITKKINGGYNGIEDRIQKAEKGRTFIKDVAFFFDKVTGGALTNVANYGEKHPLRLSFIGFFVGTMIAAVGTYLFINRKTIFK